MNNRILVFPENRRRRKKSPGRDMAVINHDAMHTCNPSSGGTLFEKKADQPMLEFLGQRIFSKRHRIWFGRLLLTLAVP